MGLRIIFLDVDGVLNSAESKGRCVGDKGEVIESPTGIDPVIVARLNRLIDATDACVVLSSTWRMWFQRTVMMLAFAGYKHNARFIGQTPDFSTQYIVRGYERGREIAAWMDHWRGEPIDSFVILDDDDDMVDLLPRLVQTDFLTGLTDEHVDRAIAMLKGEAGKLERFTG